MKLNEFLLLFLLIRWGEPSEERLIDPEPEGEELIPKLYKVIERNEDYTELGEGWQRLEEESSLFANDEFLEFLNCSIESITNETSEILKSKCLKKYH